MRNELSYRDEMIWLQPCLPYKRNGSNCSKKYALSIHNIFLVSTLFSASEVFPFSICLRQKKTYPNS